MYDAALGRFLSPDPLALASASYNTYHYAASNPVMFNDPLGLKAAGPITGPYAEFWNQAFAYANGYGGMWTPHDGWVPFNSDEESLYYGAAYMAENSAWGLYNGWAGSYEEAASRFNAANSTQVATSAPGGYVTVQGGYYRTASGQETIINGNSGEFTAYFVGKNGGGVTATSGEVMRKAGPIMLG